MSRTQNSVVHAGVHPYACRSSWDDVLGYQQRGRSAQLAELGDWETRFNPLLLLLLRTRERGSYGSGSGPLERAAINDYLLSGKARGIRELDAGIFFFRIALDVEMWKW